MFCFCPARLRKWCGKLSIRCGMGGGCKCRHCEVLTIHHFFHQSGRGGRSGGFSIARFHVFPARVFLDMSQEAHIHNMILLLGQTGAGVGTGLGGNGAGDEAGDGDWAGDGAGDRDGDGDGHGHGDGEQ